MIAVNHLQINYLDLQTFNNNRSALYSLGRQRPGIICSTKAHNLSKNCSTFKYLLFTSSVQLQRSRFRWSTTAEPTPHLQYCPMR